MLAVVEQNPTISWFDLIENVAIEFDEPSDIEIASVGASNENDNDDLVGFTL